MSTTEKNREAFVRDLRAKLATMRGGRLKDVAATIGEDANLHDAGLVDSLTTVELIIFIEDWFDREIPLEDHPPRVFHTMSSIWDTFSVVQVTA